MAKKKKSGTGEAEILQEIVRRMPPPVPNMDDFYPAFKNPVGRPLKFEPKELAEKFLEYIEWCKNHPLESIRENTTSGDASYSNQFFERKPRLVSVRGFLVFIGGNKAWWSKLDEREDGEIFVNLKDAIREYCESYQLEMASAGFFKQNIISRMLGLVDKKEVESTGDGINIIVKSEEEKEKIEKIGELGI